MTVRSERGDLSRDGEEIFLYDGVLLVREAREERPEARMKTSFLHVVRDRSLALTDREVLIEEDHRSLSGRGMEYNYDSGQMLLRAEVRGRCEPQRFRQRQDPKDGKEGAWMDGEALRMEIDDRKSTIELFDSARVNRDGDEVTGNYIFVDQRSDYFSVSSGKGAPGRVKAIIQPK